MLEFLTGILIIVACLGLEGFFSGTETAIVTLDRPRIKALAEKGSRTAALIYAALQNPEKFFSTTLLGTNVVTVLGNTVATFMVIHYAGEDYKYLTIVIMTPFILLCGELVPKTVYRYHAEKIAHYIIYPLKAVSILFYPFVMLLTLLTRLIVRPFGLSSSQLQPHTTREDIENYLDMWNMDSTLRTAEKKIIERIFDFCETSVEDIMIRLVNTEALEVQDSIDRAVQLARKTGFSRIPVYADEVYNIIGIVHAFDLLTAQKKAQTLRAVMRPARYVPNSAPIDDLLKQMQTAGDSIAVVVNEYGGTIGIVTIEDILEEVVGEIYDEHDKQESLLAKTGPNRYLVNARMEIEALNERLGLGLPRDDYETLAGFLLKHMERIPRPGESLVFGSTTFVIRRADKRSIKEVSITISDKPRGAGGDNG